MRDRERESERETETERERERVRKELILTQAKKRKLVFFKLIRSK